jgi:hypothetical protein
MDCHPPNEALAQPQLAVVERKQKRHPVQTSGDALDWFIGERYAAEPLRLGCLVISLAVARRALYLNRRQIVEQLLGLLDATHFSGESGCLDQASFFTGSGS